jgi:enoyl-CoA hydratase
MSEKVIQDGDLLVRELGALRRITLNRPAALNALTLDMAAVMTRVLRAWADDASVGIVLLDGSGERAFCAGGDIRALYDAALSGGSLPQEFWATEYRLDVLIARYPKPVVAVMDGLVMGGGVGLAAHASHRIVTERSSVAMPEAAIGYFPDVGACFLLARAPGFVGTHLALTGARANAADAIYCGLADVHVEAARLSHLAAALADCRTAEDVGDRLAEMSVNPPAGELASARGWIEFCYGADDVETIVERLRDSDAAAARAAHALLQKASPTSLKITLRNLRASLSFTRVEQSFQQDYRLSLACIAGHDFIEGIRAAIVDKDRNPAWRPDKLEEVTPDIVDRHFKFAGALELSFTE